MNKIISSQWRKYMHRIIGIEMSLVCFSFLYCFEIGEDDISLIRNLRDESGKPYVVDVDNFRMGAMQYIDRDYIFDYIPDFLQGGTHIRTAGNDKFIDEAQPCMTFKVSVPVTVYIVYADKLRIVPLWLKDFAPGKVTLNGNLSPEMSKNAEFKQMKGGNFCMYSVVVVAKSSEKLAEVIVENIVNKSHH